LWFLSGDLIFQNLWFLSDEGTTSSGISDHLIGTTSSGISDHLIDIYIAGATGVLLHINVELTMGE
jgi:hypothetical protein